MSQVDPRDLQLSSYDFALAPSFIAQHPTDRRDHSRLMHLSQDGGIAHRSFFDFPSLCQPGDVLVYNDSKVIPARLLGSIHGSGRAAELLLLKRQDGPCWEVLCRPGKKLRPGAVVEFLEGRLQARILSILEGGKRLVHFEFEGVFEERLDEAGVLPLPPYITEQLKDQSRYQTIYARAKGSAAAPTAGLHFTTEVLGALKARGVFLAPLTLHVGLGTFRPVQEEQVDQHLMHAEAYELSEDSAALIKEARAQGGRVLAVGTTSCRVLESLADANGQLKAQAGSTEIFIYPGYEFKVVDALLTNFHLPKSSLLLLVAALVGRERILSAYELAKQEGYRFFSFGDAMFLEGAPR